AALPPTGGECGDPGDAVAELERSREILASGDEGLAGIAARAEAVAAAARGSWGEAGAQFVKAAETFRRHGMVWQEARTFQSWGYSLRAGVDRHAAIEKLDAAIEIHRRHGVTSGEMEGVGRPSTSPRAVFRREGEYWTVSWRG